MSAGIAAPSPPADLEGGLLVTLRASGEDFRAFVTSDEGIRQVLDVWERGVATPIPVGPIARGPGPGDSNGPWSWHFDPEEFRMAAATIELCDGRPSYVENDLDYWVDTVGGFCPWGAEMVDVVDLR